MNDYANVINENNTCNHMSGYDLDQVDVTLIDADKPDLGVQLQYEGGNFCAENNKFSLLVQLNCNENKQDTSYELDMESI